MSETVLLALRNHRQWAKTLASVVSDIESTDVTAVLLHVFSEEEAETTRENVESGSSFSPDDLAARKSGVVTAREELAATGVEVEIRGTVGDPGEDILAVADEESADRLYLYGRKRSPAGKAVFGSTVQRVLLNSTVPVTVVPARMD